MVLLQKILSAISAHKKRSAIIAVVFLIVLFFAVKIFGSNKQQPQYQTASATTGTLISTVSESGQVIASNRVEITTQASGVVSHVYVKDGDTVTAGEKIADLTLDTDGAQRQAQAWASYLSAQNALASSQATMYSDQSTMFSKWNTYYTLATNSTYQNPDGSPNTSNRTLPAFTTVQDDWLNAQAVYQNQQNVVTQEQAALNSSWLAYQSTSSTITSPGAGVITDIVITPGMVITSSTTGNGTTVASQPVASIRTEGAPVVSVSLSEVDAVKVEPGQKATITFDALPNQTFTGKVAGVDTTGVVSSGVTTYPTTIVLDIPNNKILPNMSATANIITSVKDNVLMVPTAAVQTLGGQSTVRVLKNGQMTVVPVTTGDTSDTDTEITSGLSSGDTVVVGYVSTGATGSTTASPFSRSIFGGGGFGGGGAVRIGGGARGG